MLLLQKVLFNRIAISAPEDFLPEKSKGGQDKAGENQGIKQGEMQTVCGEKQYKKRLTTKIRGVAVRGPEREITLSDI